MHQDTVYNAFPKASETTAEELFRKIKPDAGKLGNENYDWMDFLRCLRRLRVKKDIRVSRIDGRGKKKYSLC